MQTNNLFKTIFFLLLAFGLQGQIIAQKNGAATELYQLNFLLGEWDVTDKSGQHIAETRIHLIGGTHLIEETYESTDGFKSKRTLQYDERSKLWQQSLTDELGSTMHFKGEAKDGKLTLKSVTFDKNGIATRHQIVYQEAPNGTLKYQWKSSKNAQHWETLYDETYRRKKAIL